LKLLKLNQVDFF
jgi:phage terminase large subunit-like protein